uniref:ribosomal maturation YjgA family protein n=1 Tax=Acetatifactor sp. TaxID=1872090 RepID=UPI004056B629
MYKIVKNRKRWWYLIATVLLLVIEVFIALFVQDRLIRPYVGDVLVVIVIYSFVRIFVPNKVNLLSLYIFLFAVVVEVLQYFEIVRLLKLEESRFLSILIGSVFDFKDIVCYGVGCIFLGLYEWLSRK